jgi:hypothetical protein
VLGFFCAFHLDLHASWAWGKEPQGVGKGLIFRRRVSWCSEKGTGFGVMDSSSSPDSDIF